MREAYENYPHANEMSYKDLINRSSYTPPESYKLNNLGQKEFIINEPEKLSTIVNKWDPDSRTETLSGDNVPRPIAELKVRPK